MREAWASSLLVPGYAAELLLFGRGAAPPPIGCQALYSREEVTGGRSEEKESGNPCPGRIV